MNRFYALDLDDDQVLDEQADAVTDIKFFALKDYWKWDLCLDPESAFPEFMSEAGLVRTFQQARPQ